MSQARAALKDAQVHAFAGGRSAMVAFLTKMPDARVLPDDFPLAYLTQVIAIGSDGVVRRVDRFVEEPKVDVLIQLVDPTCDSTKWPDRRDHAEFDPRARW